MKFIVAFIVVLAAAAAWGQSAGQPAVVSLSGDWRFALDRSDTGVKDRWFATNLTDGIKLPGILQAQGYGDVLSTATPWVAALPRDMRWYLIPQYKPYTQTGHIEMPYLSQPPMHYLGVAWYQRDFMAPADGKHYELSLERTHWQSQAWVDDEPAGEYQSFVAPHWFDLGNLTAGKHRLTIRIDNDTRKIKPPYRPDGHSVSDSEGATWNGIVGKIEIHVTSPVWIDDAQVYPDLEKKTLHVKLAIGNSTGQDGQGTISALGQSAAARWTKDGGTAEMDLPIADAGAVWSEFTPRLEHLSLHLSGGGADDQRDITYGLREIRRDGTRFLLNGVPLEIRGTHDGGGFPLTGYPAMDVAAWKQIFTTCKSYGLNAMRFHSWCPPDAAFTAADELGFYLQPECGMWNSFDPAKQMLGMLNDETARMARAYGNHPSFLLLSPTNEPAGHYQEQLPVWVNRWRAEDPRRLYTTGTGRPSVARGAPAAGGNDFLITGARGPQGWFGNDFSASPFISRLDVPALAHELGQWCAYPDFGVMKKFTGYLQPSNYVVARDSAAAHGLLANNAAIANASGRFQVECYKEELEANQRTAGYSGFELLDLHDYLGQGTALIGVLDAFWETKGYVTPEEFRRFCNTTVLLARVKSRVYTSAQTLNCPVEICHFGPAALKAAASSWKLVDGAGKTAASGAFAARDIPIGRGTSLGTVSADLSGLAAPAEYDLVVQLDGTEFANDWKIWVYPAQPPAAAGSDVVVTRAWAEAEKALAGGGKVLFLPAASDLDEANPRLTMTPIFWNRLMNPNGTSFLGLWCDAKHPALAGFPTEANCDWQWTDLFAGGHAINLDKLPAEMTPIVMSIDDWTRNFRLGVIYECRVGPGKLMVCGLDLSAKRPGASSLKNSLLRYMGSEKFNPAVEAPLADVRNQWLSSRAAGYVSEANLARPPQPQSADVQAPAAAPRP